eukprot:974980-Ditylum_brightwellii.AAC.1
MQSQSIAQADIFGGDEEDEEEDEDATQALLGPHMAQMLLTLSKKEVIKVKHEVIRNLDNSTNMSAFEAWPFKKAKIVAQKKKKKSTAKGEKK